MSFDQALLAFTLGASSGVGCALTCIPILVPRIAADTPHLRGGFLTSMTFSMGRLGSYLLLGVAMAYLGGTFVDLAVRATFYPIVLLILGGVLMVYGISLVKDVRVGLGRRFCGYLSGSRTTFLLGFLSSFSLCVPLIVSLTYVLTLGDLYAGMLFMTAFWLGTSIYMLAVGVVVGGVARMGSVRVGLARIRRICGYASMVVGLVFLLNSVGSLLM